MFFLHPMYVQPSFSFPHPQEGAGKFHNGARSELSVVTLEPPQKVI